MPTKQYNVFISYSHKDGEVFANEIAERISKDPAGAGITFWKDYDNMRYGQWSKQIEEAIDAVEFLVMVITPEALASPNCKDEWMYARKKGVCILPVNGLANDIHFYETFPKWLKKQHIYNLEKQWLRFINDLNAQPEIVSVPFMAPRLSVLPVYVPRYEKLARLKDLLLKGSNGNTVGITTTLQGSGGFGKTTLAIALCNDDDIINHFDDGILWVTLGQQSGTARDALHKLYRALSRNEAAFIDVEEAQQHVAAKMEKRNCLVVLDDVWKTQDLKQIVDALGNATVLITTRFAHVFPQRQVQLVKVDEMESAESIALLAGNIKDKLQNTKTFKELAEQLGHWPLLLKLAGAQISKRVLEGETLEQAVAFVQKKYDRKGITGFDYDDAVQRDDSVKKCLDASIELLTGDEKEKLLHLGIFPDDENIPFDIISLLWSGDAFDTEEILERLHQLALLDLDLVNKTCSIHDVLLHFYNEQLGKATASGLHESLVTSLGDFKNFKNNYSWKWYLWHLVRGGKIEEANHLLQDFDWIEFKLFATDIIELSKDFEHQPLDVNSDLIYRALKLSAHVLAEEKTQLPSQLIGRLNNFANEPVRGLLKKAKHWKRGPWIKPVNSSLTPPGNLIRILRGHTDFIHSILAQDNKLISASHDLTIRIWQIDSGQCLKILMGHTDKITSLLIEEGKIISGSADKTIRIWDIESGQCIQILMGHNAGISSLSVHDNKVISGSHDKTIRIWDIASGQCVQMFTGHDAAINSLSVHDKKIVSGSENKTIRIWDLESGHCVKTLTGDTHLVNLIVQERKIIGRLDNMTLCIWDLQSAHCIHQLKGHTGRINSLAVKGNKIISGSMDNTIKIWDIKSGECLLTLDHAAAVASLIVQGDKIISWSIDRIISIWEIETGLCLQTLHVANGFFRSLCGHEGKFFHGTDDRNILIWDIEPALGMDALRGHTDYITALLAWNGKIISGSADKTIRIWETSSGRCLQILQGHTDYIGTLLVQNGKIISGTDGTVRIWEMESGKCLQILQPTASLIIHEDKIISDSKDGTIRIWEMESGKCIQTIQANSNGYGSLLKYENKIISISIDYSIYVWEIQSGRCLQILRGHTGWIWPILVHGNKIFSGSHDKTIRVWDIDSGQCLQILAGHNDSIGSISVHDKKIISSSRDTAIRVWDIDSGQCLHILQGHTTSIDQVLVHGNKIITGSGDTTIRVWDIDSGQCLQVLEEHPGSITAMAIKGNKLISTDSSGVLIIYDLITLTQLSKYYTDTEFAREIVFDNDRIVCGDKLGQLHILEMIGI